MLKEKREKLCKTLAIKCVKSENSKLNNIFSKKRNLKMEWTKEIMKHLKANLQKQKDSKTHLYHLCKDYTIQNTYNFKSKNSKRKIEFNGD